MQHNFPSEVKLKGTYDQRIKTSTNQFTSEEFC